MLAGFSFRLYSRVGKFCYVPNECDALAESGNDYSRLYPFGAA
jgi:hypothetical protein